jgi:nucleotide-binding universal stress UspA family protein
VIQNVLVAVDGSEGSRKAARLGGEIAGKFGCQLTLLHVIEPPRMAPIEAYGLTMAQVYEVQMQGARAMLAEVAKELPGVQVEQVIVNGSPGEAICQQAEERNADLVLVGSRGLAKVGRWLLGSVSDRIVHHCRRPVTVVH